MNNRILIVDDDAIMQKLLGGILSGQGYELLFAGNGEEGLAVFRDKIPVLMIVDLCMPVMDGVSLVQALHIQATDPYAVIVLTGEGDAEDVKACYQAGVSAFLHKPVEPHELRGLVKSLVELKHAHNELGRRKLQLEEQARALEKERAMFQCITSAAPDAIIMMDDHGRTSFWNEAAARIFGYTAEEALGEDLHSFLMPLRYEEAFERNFPKYLATGCGEKLGTTMELCALTKSNEEIPVEISLARVVIDGKSHCVGVVRDISERKRLEEKLRVVQEIEVQRAVCEQAKQLAALGQLATTMAHEILQPLSVISVTIQGWDLLGKRGRLTAETVLQDVGQLKTNINRATKVLEHVRQLGRASQTVSEVDLNEVVSNALGICRSEFQRLGIWLSECLRPQLPSVLAVAEEVEQVLLNLLANARQAVLFPISRPADYRPTVMVETAATESRVQIFVEDNGGGRPEGLEERVLDPFSAPRSFELGPDLGLSVGAALMGKFHGGLILHNMPGCGARFEMWFDVEEREGLPGNGPEKGL